MFQKSVFSRQIYIAMQLVRKLTNFEPVIGRAKVQNDLI